MKKCLVILVCLNFFMQKIVEARSPTRFASPLFLCRSSSFLQQAFAPRMGFSGRPSPSRIWIIKRYHQLDKDSWYFVVGSGISDVGGYVQVFSQAWLLYKLTGSGSWLAWDATALAVGIAFGLPFAATWADKTGHREYCILSAGQFFLPAALGVLTLVHVITPTIILVFSFINGLGQSLGGSLFNRIAKDIRDRLAPEKKSTFDSFGQFKINFARMIGPLLGAAIFGQVMSRVVIS